MQPRRRRTGTGVTEREELDISWFDEGSPEERRNRAALAFSMRPRWDWYEELRANACSTLQAHNLPSSFGRYLKDQHGNWVADKQFEANDLAITKFTLDPERNELPNVSMDDGYEFLTDIAESQWGSDSIAHFAARTLQMISVLEMCRKTNDWPGAEFAAYQLRDIISALQFKQQWEDDSLTGRSVRTNLAENRTRNASLRAARARKWARPARRIAAEIWEKNPLFSISRVAASVRRRLSTIPDLTVPRHDRTICNAIKDLSPPKAGSGR